MKDLVDEIIAEEFASPDLELAWLDEDEADPKGLEAVLGYSPVQQVLMTVNIALRRQLWQLDYFSEGSIPDALIGVPASWTPDQIRQFQEPPP